MTGANIDMELGYIVHRQQKELAALTSKAGLIRRTALDGFVSALKQPLIKVILGPRRAGKSSLALQALKGKRFGYLNFEDELLLGRHLDGDEIVQAIDKVYGEVDFYLFDELQKFPNWPQFVNRLHRLGKNIIVTGSNAEMLKVELATALTGRHLAFELLPFSYRESLNSSDSTEEYFMQYLLNGGFPEVVLGNVNPSNYLETLWDAIILKDIAERYNIRNFHGLTAVLKLFLSGISSRFNTESLCRSIPGEISRPTAQKYISYGQEAYLIDELPMFNFKPRIRQKADRKAYAIDNGFYNAKHVGTSPDYGRLLENLVFVELVRRGMKPSLDLFYYSTRDGYEVDFMAGKASPQLIQVCYRMGELKTREREYRALTAASKELNASRLLIITLAEERIEIFQDKRIEILPAQKWFLEG